MSESQLPPQGYVAASPEELREVVLLRPPPRPYLLHLGLFLLTLLFALIVGARLQDNFVNARPLFINDDRFFAVSYIWRNPWRLLDGVPFAASLLGILLAHEMGHFFYALRHRVYATLPFFIPAPTQIGTFGAFIQIRSRFRSLAALFDIGIAGPIAGFAVAVPLGFIGLAWSKPLSADSPALMNLGHPLIFHGLFALVGGFEVPLSQLLLHPLAIAAWIGMLATAFNLMPGGQLDGGHIVYAVRPDAHRKITLAAMFCLLPMAMFYWLGWLVWILALWLTRRHPYVVEYPPLDPTRRSMALMGVGLFLLTFTPEPFQTGSLADLGAELLRMLTRAGL
jgi:membrane-associated protease RseP (regulator of RpoE activity)